MRRAIPVKPSKIIRTQIRFDLIAWSLTGGLGLLIAALCLSVLGIGAGLNFFQAKSPTEASPPIVQPVTTSTESEIVTLKPSAAATERLMALPTKRPTLQSTLRLTSTPTSEADNAKVCANAPPTQLEIGAKAHVSYVPPDPNRVRSEPKTFRNNIVGRIYPGDKVSILDGPVCHNNWVWWKISAEDGDLVGWTPEGDEENYWLIPEP